MSRDSTMFIYSWPTGCPCRPRCEDNNRAESIDWGRYQLATEETIPTGPILDRRSSVPNSWVLEMPGRDPSCFCEPQAMEGIVHKLPEQFTAYITAITEEHHGGPLNCITLPSFTRARRAFRNGYEYLPAHLSIFSPSSLGIARMISHYPRSRVTLPSCPLDTLFYASENPTSSNHSPFGSPSSELPHILLSPCFQHSIICLGRLFENHRTRLR